ncbi:MAG: polyphosphate kinase 2 family protein [Candidatus Eisenbacteria bacterium]
MKSLSERLNVNGRGFKLKSWDADSTPGCRDKEEAVERTAENIARIDELQYRLYAENRRSLLIVLQGMDASGKDGCIRKVMAAFNPVGAHVHAFKVPTPEEANHDFLWRIHKVTPGRGEVAIFNRSHYEDVLVVRVHGLVPEKEWKRRYLLVNDFERHLSESGTSVLKFFLHINRDEQRERLLKRLEDPSRNWKFNESDLEERIRWDDYQKAFQDALAHCATPLAPWFVIPANHKWYRDFAVSEIVAETLEKMAPQPPKVKLDVKRLKARLRKK